jgi:presenilin-like A22 family membrane protease
MKIQDILFGITYISLILIGKPQIWIFTALTCLAISSVLYYFRIFFTAERLVWYASAFILTNIIMLIYSRGQFSQKS